jgi:predicted dienelactone hydrolase
VAKRGRIGITVCSAAFTTLGRAQARALGHAELPIAVIPHPFGTRGRDEVRQIAEQCAADIVKLISGQAS